MVTDLASVLSTVPEPLQGLITQLQRLPSRIAAADTRLLNLGVTLAKTKLAIKNVELLCLVDIAREKEGDKPKYPNEASRSAELNARLGLDATYSKLDDEIRSLEEEINLAKVESANLHHEQNNTNSIIGLYTAILRR